MGRVEEGSWGEEQREIRFVKGRVLCRLDPLDGNPRESIPIEEFDEWIAEFSLVRSRHALPPGWFLYENPERNTLEDGETLSTIDAINTSINRLDGLNYTAYPDGLMAYHTIRPSDSRYPRQWGLRAVGVDKAWACTKGDPGVWLAIVDSGMPVVGDPDPDHPRFVHEDLDDASRFRFGLAFKAGDARFEPFSNYSVPADQLPEDKEGHGTHVLGIMAAEAGNVSSQGSGGTVGVNWVSPVYVTAMEPMIGVGGIALGSGASQLAMAITEIASWMRASQTRNVVINISMGGEDFTRTIVQLAITAAVDAGAIIVASTGNSFGGANSVDCFGDVCAPASYAVDFPHGVISVGAYEEPPQGDGPVVAPWSNPTNGIVDPGPVTVVAPGAGIHSTTYVGQNDDWGDMDGTSQAAPLVAGIVSLYWGLNQTLTNGQVIQAVKDSAVPLDDSATPHRRWGHGRIDAEGLVCGETTDSTVLGHDETGGDDPDPVHQITWRHKVEVCAFDLSENVLSEIGDDDACANVTTRQLAASLALRGWLGDADWDGTGRTSGGI